MSLKQTFSNSRHFLHWEAPSFSLSTLTVRNKDAYPKLYRPDSRYRIWKCLPNSWYIITDINIVMYTWPLQSKTSIVFEPILKAWRKIPSCHFGRWFWQQNPATHWSNEGVASSTNTTPQIIPGLRVMNPRWRWRRTRLFQHNHIHQQRYKPMYRDILSRRQFISTKKRRFHEKSTAWSFSNHR